MKLTALDNKLLYELDIDSRQSLSTLAKRLKVSQQRARYRLKLMEENNIIQGYLSVIDITKLGYFTFRVYIQYAGIGTKKEEELTQYLLENPYVQWIGHFSGSWDLEIALFARNFFHYTQLFDEILDKYGDCFQNTFLTVSLDTHYFTRKYLWPSKKRVSSVKFYGGEPQNNSVDEVDIKILDVLSKNARTSLVHMAQHTGLTANAVKKRVRQLEKRKVLQSYTLLLNTGKMGIEFYKVLINVRRMNKKMESKIISFCEKFPTIWFFIRCHGAWNVEFEVEVQNNEELRQIINEFRNEFGSDVLSYDTLACHRISKLNFFPSDLKVLRPSS